MPVYALTASAWQSNGTVFINFIQYLSQKVIIMQHSSFNWLQGIAEKSPLCYFAIDLNRNRFLYRNAALKKVFDTANLPELPSEAIHLIHPEDRAYMHDQFDLWRKGEHTDIECRVLLEDKVVSWWGIHLFRESADTQTDVCYGYIEDITVLKEQFEVLRKYANKKNAVLNILTHDLASPLGSINNAVSILVQKTGEHPDPQVSQFLGMIDRLSKRSINLIQNFINQEFLESTSTRIMKSRVDLILKIREMVDEYNKPESILSKRISFATQHESLFISIDEPKFLQVISNLLSNAIKFTPDNGSINISVEEKRSTVLLSIADTGIGIPSQFHDTLFEKFSLARRTGLQGETSVGLGMYVIKTIVEWHEGKIWFESEENKGTAFFIEIPKQ
jgi:two-component system sensor histidine kinase VicK